jgi:hypothetical protein
MRSIYRSTILVALASIPLVACGGDDDGGNNNPTPDAKVFMDAPADMAAVCGIAAMYNGGTAGSDAMRQSANWIRKTTVNNVMLTIFSVSFPVDMNKNYVTVGVIKNGANWTVNTPINFDPSPTAAMPAAFAYMDENLDIMTGNSTRTLWASTGSITFSEIAQTMGAKITFSTTAATFREINMMGADVAGGCTSSVGALMAFLTQMTLVQLNPSEETTVDATQLGLADLRKLTLHRAAQL